MQNKVSLGRGCRAKSKDEVTCKQVNRTKKRAKKKQPTTG
jgi:hypothetical protein